MSVYYKAMSTSRPGQGQEGAKMWFPKITGSSPIHLEEIAKILQKRSTASESDVYLIVKGLVELIPELISDGYTVKLDELGSFRLHARVHAAESPEKVSSKNIKELKMSFLPDKKIKRKLQMVKVLPVKVG
jgi:predicted histone-like DNA-binding protein